MIHLKLRRLVVLLMMMAVVMVGLGSLFVDGQLVPFDFTYTGYSASGYCASPSPSPTYRTCIFEMPQCGNTDRFQKTWTVSLSMPSGIAGAGQWSVDSGTVNSVTTSSMIYTIPSFSVGVHDVKFTMPNTPTGGYSMRFVGCTTVNNPVVASVSTDNARQGGGTIITLVGQYLGQNMHTTSSASVLLKLVSPPVSPPVSFATTVVSWAPTQIVVTTPVVSTFGIFNLIISYPNDGFTISAPTGVTVRDVKGYAPPRISSGTALPSQTSAAGVNVTMYGEWFEKNEPQHYWLNFTTSSDSSFVPVPRYLRPVVNANNYELVFTFVPGAIGPEETRSVWTLYYTGGRDFATGAPVTTVLNKIRVHSSPYAVVLPYSKAESMDNYIRGRITSLPPVTLKLARTDQILARLEFSEPVGFSFNAGAPPSADLEIGFLLPEEYRPIITQRCYAHIIVNGTPKELKADIQPSGSVVFYSTLDAQKWTTGGALYFNGCKWFVPF